MAEVWLPIFVFAIVAIALSVGMLGAGWLIGPSRQGRVKEMPYESGMNPIHDARRRFDVRFHLVAIAFLVFDVELLFLYPWAVSSRHEQGINKAVAMGLVSGRGLVFGDHTILSLCWGLGSSTPGEREFFSGDRTSGKRRRQSTRQPGQLVPQEQSVADAFCHGLLWHRADGDRGQPPRFGEIRRRGVSIQPASVI